jgi:hypothetical protein
MKIKLLKNAQVICTAGTVVDTDPARAEFLIAMGAAVKAEETPTDQAPAKAKKATKK